MLARLLLMLPPSASAQNAFASDHDSAVLENLL